MSPPPQREVVHGDALAWMAERPAMPGVSVICSIPDVSELGTTMPLWEAWFIEAARLALRVTPPDGVTVFFHTDLKHEGRWISKAALVLRAADRPLLWHKVVCRKPAGDVSRGRPGFSNLLAFSESVRDDANRPFPDVLPSLGEMAWSHSMGSAAASLAAGFVRRMSPATHTIVAPFCGLGAALDAANRVGLAAIGIERNRKRAERARVVKLEPAPPTAV